MDNQYNGQQKTDKNDLQNTTQKTKDVQQEPHIKPWMNSGTRVAHVKNPMIIHEESVSVNVHNIVIIGQCHSMKNNFWSI